MKHILHSIIFGAFAAIMLLLFAWLFICFTAWKMLPIGDGFYIAARMLFIFGTFFWFFMEMPKRNQSKDGK